LGVSHAQVDDDESAGKHQRVADVVAVAGPTDGRALKAAAVLEDGQQVGEDLARDVFVAQGVDDRYGRVRRASSVIFECSNTAAMMQSTQRDRLRATSGTGLACAQSMSVGPSNR